MKITIEEFSKLNIVGWFYPKFCEICLTTLNTVDKGFIILFTKERESYCLCVECMNIVSKEKLKTTGIGTRIKS